MALGRDLYLVPGSLRRALGVREVLLAGLALPVLDAAGLGAGRFRGVVVRQLVRDGIGRGGLRSGVLFAVRAVVGRDRRGVDHLAGRRAERRVLGGDRRLNGLLAVVRLAREGHLGGAVVVRPGPAILVDLPGAVKLIGLLGLGIHAAAGLVKVAGDGVSAPVQEGVVGLAADGVRDVAGVAVGEVDLDLLVFLGGEVDRADDRLARLDDELGLASGVVMAEVEHDLHVVVLRVIVEEMDDLVRVLLVVAGIAGPLVHAVDDVQARVRGDHDERGGIGIRDVVQGGLQAADDGVGVVQRAVAAVLLVVVDADDVQAGLVRLADEGAGVDGTGILLIIVDDADAAVIRRGAEIGEDGGLRRGRAGLVVAGDPNDVDAGHLQRHDLDDLLGPRLVRLGAVVPVAGGDDQRGDHALVGLEHVVERAADVVPRLVDVGIGDEGVLKDAGRQDHVGGPGVDAETALRGGLHKAVDGHFDRLARVVLVHGERAVFKADVVRRIGRRAAGVPHGAVLADQPARADPVGHKDQAAAAVFQAVGGRGRRGGLVALVVRRRLADGLLLDERVAGAGAELLVAGGCPDLGGLGLRGIVQLHGRDVGAVSADGVERAAFIGVADDIVAVQREGLHGSRGVAGVGIEAGIVAAFLAAFTAAFAAFTAAFGGRVAAAAGHERAVRLVDADVRRRRAAVQEQREGRSVKLQIVFIGGAAAAAVPQEGLIANGQVPVVLGLGGVDSDSGAVLDVAQNDGRVADVAHHIAEAVGPHEAPLRGGGGRLRSGLQRADARAVIVHGVELAVDVHAEDILAVPDGLRAGAVQNDVLRRVGAARDEVDVEHAADVAAGAADGVMGPEAVGGLAESDQLLEPGRLDEKVLAARLVVDESKAYFAVAFVQILGASGGLGFDLNGRGEVDAVRMDEHILAAADDIREIAEGGHSAAAAAGDTAATAAAGAGVAAVSGAGGEAGNGAGHGIDAVSKSVDRDRQRADEDAFLDGAGDLRIVGLAAAGPAGVRPFAEDLVPGLIVRDGARPGFDIGHAVELPGEEKVFRVGVLGKGGLDGVGVGLRVIALADVDPFLGRHLLGDRGRADAASRAGVGAAAASAAASAASAAGAIAGAVGRAGELVDGDGRRVGGPAVIVDEVIALFRIERGEI